MEKPKEVSSTIHILQMTQSFWEIEKDLPKFTQIQFLKFLLCLACNIMSFLVA